MKRLPAALHAAARLLAALALVAAAPAGAQGLPIVKGEPVTALPAKSEPIPGLLTSEEEFPARRLRLAAPSDRELRAMDAGSGMAKRERIGFGRDVGADAEEGSGTSLAWSRVGEWKIAKLRVQSPGATALRVGLRIGATAQPWTLRVAGSDDESKSLGPMRLAGPLGREELHWTPLTEGDAQVIEIASPASQPDPTVEVALVSHLVTGPSSGFHKAITTIGNSGSCNIDVACVSNPSQALLDAANSVARMAFTGTDGASYLCTGTLLNDLNSNTQVPYLFSANHCFEAPSAPYNDATAMQQVASSLNTFFFLKAATCGSLATPFYVQRFGGATFLYNNLASDVLFLRLNDWAPAGTFLAGWDANPIPSGAAMTVLHHPSGDLEKFSTGTTGSFTSLPSPNNASTGFMSVTYGQGTTEGGSSGAGLLTFSNGQYYLRGGLWGGLASCSALTSPDYYSRLDVVYPSLRQWLEAAAFPDFDFTDLWWNPNENGWGMNIAQHPSGQLFAVWYTYAADYGPLWLVMAGGQWTTSRTFTGKLYRTSGPAYNQLPFDPTKVKVNEVGTLTFNFTDANNGSFTWVVDGVQGSKVITRQPF